jgi:putative ABC transport system ATP-binding protein
MSIRAPAEIPTNTVAAVIAARDLVRRYGEGDAAVQALRGVSLDIDRGRLTAVMGLRAPASPR